MTEKSPYVFWQLSYIFHSWESQIMVIPSESGNESKFPHM